MKKAYTTSQKKNKDKKRENLLRALTAIFLNFHF